MTRCWPSAAAWCATWSASPRPATCAASGSSTCRRRCWPRSTRPSAARPASITPRGKNLIGAFYQPLCVVADTSLLATLSPRAFAAGMAEVAKIGMILDADLFEPPGTRRASLHASRRGGTRAAGRALDRAQGRDRRTRRARVRRSDAVELRAHRRPRARSGRRLWHAAARRGGVRRHAGRGVRSPAAWACSTPTRSNRQTALLDALHLPLRWHGRP